MDMHSNNETMCTSSSDAENMSSNDKMQVLNLLLHECSIDPNTKREDETLLLMTLRTRQSDASILRLLKLDCDANATNRLGKIPLHIAIKRPTMAVAEELLERGANIDAQDTNQFTPLHYAVMKSHEAVCMLLYYGADVNIMCCHNMLPLNLALFSREFESAETLLNYYDDQDLFEVFDLFLGDNSKTMEDLLSSDKPDLFKMVWNRIDHFILTELKVPFLVYYLSQCTYSLPQWIECLELILQAPAAVDLIENFNDYVHRTYRYTFISMLLYTLYKRNASSLDRVSTVYLTLSLGSEVYINDANCIYELHGFGDELEAFIFAADYKRSVEANYGPNTFYFALLPFIFALEGSFDMTTVLGLFESQIKGRFQTADTTKHSHIINALRFFSLSSCLKVELLRLCQRHLSSYNAVAKKLETVPEFPSLLELSRNRSYKVMRQEVQKAYQFHVAVKNLKLPQKLKDILRFKAPIY